MQIVADREIAAAETAFGEFGTVELVAGRKLRAAQLGDADILLVRSVTRVNHDLLGGTPVKFVGTATAGTDHIEVDYLRTRGIAFAAAPGSNARAVAEYVLACVLFQLLDADLDPAELTAGIIGCGNTGTAVAALLRGIGVTCKLNDPPRAATDKGQAFVSLDEALDADIVTLHVPLTDSGLYQTHDLIDAHAIAKLRPGAVLINTARGGVIKEQDLIEALDGPMPVKAVIDCWQGEPAVDRELLKRAFLGSPHIAGHSVDARINATSLLHEAVAHHLGQVPCWRPDKARPDTVALALPDVAGDRVEILSQAVFAVVDPRRVTALLRRAIGLPTNHVGRYFGEVRRSLGTRREFSNYAVATPRLTPDTVAALRALGFCTDR